MIFSGIVLAIPILALRKRTAQAHKPVEISLFCGDFEGMAQKISDLRRSATFGSFVADAEHHPGSEFPLTNITQFFEAESQLYVWSPIALCSMLLAILLRILHAICAQQRTAGV